MRPWESAWPSAAGAGTYAHGRMDQPKISSPQEVNVWLTSCDRPGCRTPPSAWSRGRLCRGCGINWGNRADGTIGVEPRLVMPGPSQTALGLARQSMFRDMPPPGLSPDFSQPVAGFSLGKAWTRVLWHGRADLHALCVSTRYGKSRESAVSGSFRRREKCGLAEQVGPSAARPDIPTMPAAAAGRRAEPIESFGSRFECRARPKAAVGSRLARTDLPASILKSRMPERFRQMGNRSRDALPRFPPPPRKEGCGPTAPGAG
jgi:hypothetical protein